MVQALAIVRLGTRDISVLLQKRFLVYSGVFIAGGTVDRSIEIYWSRFLSAIVNAKLWCSKSDCQSIDPVLQAFLLTCLAWYETWGAGGAAD
jgi:hypothetical protein